MFELFNFISDVCKSHTFQAQAIGQVLQWYVICIYALNHHLLSCPRLPILLLSQ